MAAIPKPPRARVPGLCSRCKSRVPEKGRTCETCRRASRESCKLRRRRLSGAGRCVWCGAEKPRDGSSRCEACIALDSERSRDRRRAAREASA